MRTSVLFEWKIAMSMSSDRQKWNGIREVRGLSLLKQCFR